MRSRALLLVDVNPSLSILGSPPDATIGVAYSYTFTYFGGTTPYKCTVVGSVPTGWSFDTDTGELSHASPDTPGPVTLTLKLRDADYRERTQAFTWSVIALPLIITNSPPDYIAGVAQSFSYTSTGGAGAMTWSVVTGYALPPGITLDSDGTFHGTTTNPSGENIPGVFEYNWLVQVEDEFGAITQLHNTVQVTAVAISISNTFPDYTAGVAQSFTYTATGGTGSKTWSVTSGTLPPGLSLSAAGDITGTTTGLSVGTHVYSYTVMVSDAALTQWTISESVTVTVVAISITNSAPDGQISLAYSHTYTYSGGTGSVTWSVLSGTLPSGLSLSSAGVLSGTPDTVETATFTVRVEDAAGTTADLAESVSISREHILTEGSDVIAAENNDRLSLE